MTKLIVLLFLTSLFSQGAYFKVQISELKADQEPLQGELQMASWRMGQESLMPIARFEKFAFVVPDFDEDGEDWLRMTRWNRNLGQTSSAWLILKMEKATGQKGFLDVWNQDREIWQTVPCEIEAGNLQKCDGKEAAMVLKWYDRYRLDVGSRGGLWYRGRSGGGVNGRRGSDFDRTFSTMSGGRALAENLALDRDLILSRGKNDEEFAISKIKGVTVTPIPWEEWMPKGEIEVDALSMLVPEDQHLMIVPSLKNFFGLLEKVEKTGAPVFQSFAEGSEYRGLSSRYRTQMGLDLPEALARLLPVGSVAVTGGDPFFPTGADVAVILETEKVDFVFSALKNVVAAKANLAGAKAVDGVSVFGFQNEDRSFSSYVAKLKGAVVVANSAHQIARLGELAEGKAKALGATDEYRFFRHRYPMGKGESAYVFISDACLRRWAGPEVRIGASRRSRALSALAKVTAGQVGEGRLNKEFRPLLGEVSLVDGRVVSANYGSLGFVTPTGELEIETVSGMEKAGYERWRRGYESGWARFFDPIAIQFRLSKKSEELDMTILPLRVNSEYQQMIALAGEAVLSKGAKMAPDGSVFHFAMAIDKESELFKGAGVSLLDLLPALSVNPLGWMGESVSVSLGDDLVWDAGLDETSLPEMPILLRVEVESRLKLALFMTAMKGAIEASGPDLVRWETRKHGDRKYVAVIGDEDEIGMEVALYYATLPTALLVSLNEEMLKEAIEREEKIGKSKKAEGQMAVQTTPGFLTSVSGMASQVSLEERRRKLSYQALPVLNEWYKTKAAKDPVNFHEVRFGRTISCPGGLGYRWNEEDLTMESVAYGHPGRFRNDEKPMALLDRFGTITMESSFEEGGMRTKVGMNEKTPVEAAALQGKPRPGDDKVVAFRDLYPLKVGTELEYESRYQWDGEEEVETSKVKIEKVTEKDGVIAIVESHQGKEGEGRGHYEIGPKGFRLIKTTGRSGVIGDEKAFDYPAELWPGQIFRVRKKEFMVDEGKRFPSLTDATFTVVGWEKIKGPGGEELEALRLESKVSEVASGSFNRGATTEWHVRGLGMVKSEQKSREFEASMKLVSVKKPE